MVATGVMGSLTYWYGQPPPLREPDGGVFPPARAIPDCRGRAPSSTHASHLSPSVLMSVFVAMTVPRRIVVSERGR